MSSMVASACLMISSEGGRRKSQPEKLQLVRLTNSHEISNDYMADGKPPAEAAKFGAGKRYSSPMLLPLPLAHH